MQKCIAYVLGLSNQAICIHDGLKFWESNCHSWGIKEKYRWNFRSNQKIHWENDWKSIEKMIEENIPKCYFFYVNSNWLGSLSERTTSTTRYTRYIRHKDFPRGNHKAENLANFLIIVLSLIQYHKIEKPKNKKSSTSLSLYPLVNVSSLSLMQTWEWVSLC